MGIKCLAQEYILVQYSDKFMHSIVLCHSQYCIVLLIYCYVDITQYNDVYKFVGVLDNPPFTDLSK